MTMKSGVLEMLCWWAVLAGIWLITVSAPTVPELIVSLAAALGCAVLAPVYPARHRLSLPPGRLVVALGPPHRAGGAERHG